MTENYSTGSFLAGIAIGVGIGMLLAPSSGADARHYIRDRAKDLKDRAGEWKERAGDYAEEGKDYVQREARRAGETADAARQAYDERKS
ncbi:MAG: YtxH domain-containing protein [Candidatus Binatia bacterium]